METSSQPPSCWEWQSWDQHTIYGTALETNSLPALTSITHDTTKRYLNNTFHGRRCVHTLLPLLRWCILRLWTRKKKALDIHKKFIAVRSDVDKTALCLRGLSDVFLSRSRAVINDRHSEWYHRPPSELYKAKDLFIMKFSCFLFSY